MYKESGILKRRRSSFDILNTKKGIFLVAFLFNFLTRDAHHLFSFNLILREEYRKKKSSTINSTYPFEFRSSRPALIRIIYKFLGTTPYQLININREICLVLKVIRFVQI